MLSSTGVIYIQISLTAIPARYADNFMRMFFWYILSDSTFIVRNVM